MVELLLIWKMLDPFVLTYVFITITGYTIMDGVVTTFHERVEREGYEYTESYRKREGKINKFIANLKNAINPIESLKMIIAVLSNADLPELMIKQSLAAGMIVFKDDNGNSKEEVQKESIDKEKEKDIKTMSNKEKIEYLENEKNFLLDGQKNNDDIIDKYVYIKKF